MDVDQLLPSPLRPDLTPRDEAAVQDTNVGCRSQTDPVDDHDVTQQSEARYSRTLPPDDKSSEDQAWAYVRNLFRVDPVMTAVHKAWFPEPMQWIQRSLTARDNVPVDRCSLASSLTADVAANISGAQVMTMPAAAVGEPSQQAPDLSLMFP